MRNKLTITLHLQVNQTAVVMVFVSEIMMNLFVYVKEDLKETIVLC